MAEKRNGKVRTAPFGGDNVHKKGKDASCKKGGDGASTEAFSFPNFGKSSLKLDNVLDRLTFTRLMTVFALNPNGLALSALASTYESVNFSTMPKQFPPDKCVKILADQGYIERKMILSRYSNEKDVTLIPTDKCRKIMNFLNYQGKQKRQFDRRLEISEHRVPPFKIPAELIKTKNWPVFVQDMGNPHYIAFQLIGKEYSEALEDLMRSMRTFYRSAEKKTLEIENMDDIDNPDVVAAPYETIGYHRAMVLEKLDEDQLMMYYIDYGNKAKCELRDLCYLKEEFKQLPCQALHGSIASFKKFKGRLSDEALVAFQGIKRLRATFKTSFKDKYWPMNLELELNDPDNDLKNVKETLQPYLAF